MFLDAATFFTWRLKLDYKDWRSVGAKVWKKAYGYRVNKDKNLEVSTPLIIDGEKGLEGFSALGGLNSPQHLVITKFPGRSLPGDIGQLQGLERLVISDCPSLFWVPASLGHLRALRHLRIQDCEGLKDLPDTLGLLCGLEHLIIWNCPDLAQIPNTIGQLGALRLLLIHGCAGLKGLPETLGQLEDLQHLVVSNCLSLTEIPFSIRELVALGHLRIQDCKNLKILPKTLQQLEGVEDVTISNCSNVSTFLITHGVSFLEARAPVHRLPGPSCAEQDSRSVKAFIAALRDKEGPHRFLVSTEWLVNLEDHEEEMLASICMETGYQTYQNTSNTYYERTEDHVQNTLTENDVAMTDVKDIFGSQVKNATSTGVSETSCDLLPNLHIDEGVHMSGSSGVLNSTQDGMKPDDIRTCAPKFLQVDCSPSEDVSGPSPSEIFFRKHFVIKKFGDCAATLPKQGDLRISTVVEKSIAMPFYRFVAKELVKEHVSLSVFVETTVSCCLRNDENPKKVHVEISKIRGEIKYVDTAGPINYDLFLQCVRTNVGAGIDHGDRFEIIPLHFQEVAGGTKLARSGRNPKGGGRPGSATVELQCQLEKSRQNCGDQALLFENEDSPAVLEGTIKQSLCDTSVLEADITYQLGLTTDEPCDPMPAKDQPFCGIMSKYPVVDFGCIIEIKTRGLLVSSF